MAELLHAAASGAAPLQAVVAPFVADGPLVGGSLVGRGDVTADTVLRADGLEHSWPGGARPQARVACTTASARTTRRSRGP